MLYYLIKCAFSAICHNSKEVTLLYMQVYVSMLYLIMVVITNNPVTGYKINRRFLPVVTDV